MVDSPQILSSYHQPHVKYSQEPSRHNTKKNTCKHSGFLFFLCVAVMSDLTIFTLVEEYAARGCKDGGKSLCTDFSSQSNKGAQRRVGIKALCLCLRICSRPACCGLFSFCKVFILCSITKDRIQSFFFFFFLNKSSLI